MIAGNRYFSHWNAPISLPTTILLFSYFSVCIFILQQGDVAEPDGGCHMCFLTALVRS